jgi:hypothetical protein
VSDCRTLYDSLEHACRVYVCALSRYRVSEYRRAPLADVDRNSVSLALFHRLQYPKDVARRDCFHRHLADVRVYIEPKETLYLRV